MIGYRNLVAATFFAASAATSNNERASGGSGLSGTHSCGRRKPLMQATERGAGFTFHPRFAAQITPAW
jgi:hypothetical protein